ncbi:MAG TPA: oligogalacturonate lyase family protein [Anaerolineaceae bacterium]
MNAIRITPEGVDFGLVYFTSNSLLADDRRMVLIQKKNNCRNLFLMDLVTGEMKQITDNTGTIDYAINNGEFLKNDADNILDGSVIVHAQSGRVYYMQGRKLCRTDVDGNVKVLAQIPANMASSCMHVSSDGRRLVVATADQRAFKDYNGTNNAVIDYTVQSLGLSSQLRVYDTENGDLVVRENINRAWVTHVQFAPGNDQVILYNHEWPADCGIRRIWLWNGLEHVLVRPEGDGRSREDWTCHEMWERNGSNLIYHGGYKNGLFYVGKAVIKDLNYLRDISLQEIAFPKEYVKYGHFTVSNTRALVTDGYYQEAGEPKGGSRWITILKPDWEQKTIEWIPLCEHGSDWKGQESHPHPIFNHRADAVYFNSNKEGYRAVYKVDVSGLDLA